MVRLSYQRENTGLWTFWNILTIFRVFENAYNLAAPFASQRAAKKRAYFTTSLVSLISVACSRNEWRAPCHCAWLEHSCRTVAMDAAPLSPGQRPVGSVNGFVGPRHNGHRV